MKNKKVSCFVKIGDKVYIYCGIVMNDAESGAGVILSDFTREENGNPESVGTYGKRECFIPWNQMMLPLMTLD
jgi:hypothetical protein